jgi:hypothetical protein
MFQHTMIQMNDAFQEAIKALSETLRQLFSAAKIVHGNHADTLSDHVRDLAKCFLKQFRYIAAGVDDWLAYVKSGSSGPLSAGFVANIKEVALQAQDFSPNANVLCEKIALLVSTRSTMWKRRAAAQKRREEELGADNPSNELPLPTSAQVLEVIDKLQEAISKTFQFSLEFGLGKVYWSFQLETNNLKTTQASVAGVNSNCLQLNPFMVDVEDITVTAMALKRQVIDLESLVENMKGKADA